LSRAEAGKSSRLSDGNPLATFAAARLKDLATTFGAHTDSKAVGLPALAIVGLKSSFHDRLSSPSVGRATLS